jgi:hypothetical protein
MTIPRTTPDLLRALRLDRTRPDDYLALTGKQALDLATRAWNYGREAGKLEAKESDNAGTISKKK